jgi:amidohydrolase
MRDAAQKEPAMPIPARIAQLSPQITDWRRALHRIPELGYDLPQTTAFVAEKLRAMGCDSVTMGLGRAGIVAEIIGTGGANHAIALRADMDALPITEATGAPYASQIAGQMHACGHDGHTAMLLGAAQYLCETRAFSGRAVLVFQPAEEGGAGGLAMVNDGLISRFGISEIYALHNMPGQAAGTFAINSGAMMASADFFDILITGRGGHAAKPQDAVDAVLIAAHLITALQSVTARNIDPLEAAVLSVCMIDTDSRAPNVLPQEVRLSGTARALSAPVRDALETRLRAICAGVAATFGAQIAVDYQRGYPVTVNSPDQADFAATAALAVTGQPTAPAAPMMGAEDFSYMLSAAGEHGQGGAYMFLGNGDSAMLHHPAYQFNDAIIPAGVAWFAALIEQRLPL